MGGFVNVLGGAGMEATNVTRGIDKARENARQRQQDLERAALTAQQLRQGNLNVRRGEQELAQGAKPFAVGAPHEIGGRLKQIVYDPQTGQFSTFDAGPVSNPYEQNLQDLDKVLAEAGVPWDHKTTLSDQQIQVAEAAGARLPSTLNRPQLKPTQDQQGAWVWGWEYPDGHTVRTNSPAPPPASTMDTVREGTQNVTMDDPSNPGHQIIVRMPVSSRTTKVPRGSSAGGGGVAAPTGGGSTRRPATPNAPFAVPQPGLPPGAQVLGGKNKLSESERRTTDAINTTIPLLTNTDPEKGDIGLIPFIEQMKIEHKNSYFDAAAARKAWFDYSVLGRDPDDPVRSQLIKYASALQVIPIAAYSGMRSSKYSFDAIIQHLPKPYDTPQNMYRKALFLRDAIIRHQVESMGQAAGAPGTKLIPDLTTQYGAGQGMSDADADKILRDNGVLVGAPK